MPLLDVQNLTVSLPAPFPAAGAGECLPVLDRVDLVVERGACVGLVGESGCGKSMTALAVVGLLPAGATARGRVLLDGRDLLALDEAGYCRVRGRRVAMVFQEPMTALNPVQPIGRQIAEGVRLHLGLNRRDAERRARRLLERVGLPPARFSPALYPHQLSGGQRQRVVIAIALACDPQLLIADEPTTALDVIVQQQIMRLILEVVDEAGMGLLLITHDLGVVAAVADQVNVMYAGRIVERALASALFTASRHPYTRGLLDAMPTLAAGRVERLRTIPGTVPPLHRRPPGCVFAGRCGRVRPRCHESTPVLSPDAAGGGQVACHYPLPPLAASEAPVPG